MYLIVGYQCFDCLAFPFLILTEFYQGNISLDLCTLHLEVPSALCLCRRCGPWLIKPLKPRRFVAFLDEGLVKLCKFISYLRFFCNLASVKTNLMLRRFIATRVLHRRLYKLQLRPCVICCTITLLFRTNLLLVQVLIQVTGFVIFYTTLKCSVRDRLKWIDLKCSISNQVCNKRLNDFAGFIYFLRQPHLESFRVYLQI